MKWAAAFRSRNFRVPPADCIYDHAAVRVCVVQRRCQAYEGVHAGQSGACMALPPHESAARSNMCISTLLQQASLKA